MFANESNVSCRSMPAPISEEEGARPWKPAGIADITGIKHRPGVEWWPWHWRERQGCDTGEWRIPGSIKCCKLSKETMQGIKKSLWMSSTHWHVKQAPYLLSIAHFFWK